MQEDNTAIRRYVRHVTGMPIEVNLEYHENYHSEDDTITNVSLGGLCFVASDRLEVNESIQVNYAKAAELGALINLAETLHPELAKEGIKLQVINPGFIRTPMTQINKFPMPFLMEVPEAVTLILKGLHANRFEIAFPWQLVSFLKVSRVLPYWLYFWMVRRLAPRE